MTLRETITNLMVNVHLIPRELAEIHVTAMSDAEAKRRFRMYSRLRSGAELSAESPNLRAGDVSSTRFSRPATMTADFRRSTLLPKRCPRSCQIRR